MSKKTPKAITTDKRIKSVSVAGKKIPVVNLSKTNEEKLRARLKAEAERTKPLTDKITAMQLEITQLKAEQAEKNKKHNKTAGLLYKAEQDLTNAKEYIKMLINTVDTYNSEVNSLASLVAEKINQGPSELAENASRFLSDLNNETIYQYTGEFKIPAEMVDGKNGWQKANVSTGQTYPMPK